MIYEYDISISFAGEDRAFAKELSSDLKSKGVKLFFDELEKNKLWGKNLTEYLHKIYKDKAKYCILIISKNYNLKNWTRLEKRSALEREFESNREYILPIRLDDSDISGIFKTKGYISAKEHTISEISDLIVKKLKDY